MKLFTIIKTGYSAGVYGNTGEYFTLITVKTGKGEPKTNYQAFHGQYGAEERVKDALEGRGWRYFYSSGVYGKIPLKDVYKGNYSEHRIIEWINGGMRYE